HAQIGAPHPARAQTGPLATHMTGNPMHTRSLELGNRALSFETGKLAKQADVSVLVRMGDTVVLVTACHAASPRVGIDFLPLTVDYREFTYASGRIPGGFFKRE